MNSAQGSIWQAFALSLVGACLLSGCHHGSSTAAGTAPLYPINVSVTGLAGSGLVLVDNGIDNLSVTGSGISTFSTQIVDFNTYVVQVLTQPVAPAQVCSVIDGVGLVDGAAATVSVSCGTVGTAVGRYAYVVNSGAGSLSGYTINATTGALTALAGSPLTVPGAISLYQAQIDPSGAFLYVLDSGRNAVFAYLINQTTGSVAEIAGSPFATGKTPVSLAFDYTGAYLYIANNGDNTISAYAVNGGTGAIAAIVGSPFAVAGVNPGPRQIIASGSYLFALNFNTSSVDVLTIAQSTGVLAEVGHGSPYATDTGPFSLAIDPTGEVLYTANQGPGLTGSISAFTLNLSDGVLMPVAGSPLPVAVVNGISIDSRSRYLFITESAGIAVYPIVNTATGVLGSPVAGSPFATGANPYLVTGDLADQFVYVANQGSASVSQFTLAPTSGVLTAVAASPVAAGAGPTFVQIQ